MKSQFIIYLMLLMCLKSFSQKDSVSVKSSYEYYDAYADYMKKITFKFGAGLFVPQGNLKDYIGNAPVFEVNANFPIKSDRSIDAVLQFIVPNQQDDFLFIRTIDTIQAKSTFMFNMFARFNKRLIKTNKSSVTLGLGIGISSITTDARNPFFEGDKDQKKYEFISSLLVMPGIQWHHRFSENTQFTFGLDLQYSPYKVEGALREDIGSMAIIPKIIYKF